MEALGGRNVLIGATGSVASIRVDALYRGLTLNGANVRVIATGNAMRFLHEVPGIYGDEEEWRQWRKMGDDVMHIEMRRWADVLIIAPLSANTLAKIANGLCDNLLTCVVRAWPIGMKPLLVAPAMNTFMWEHPFTRGQLETLENQLKMTVIQPQQKALACGDVGMGAMASVDTIIEAVADELKRDRSMQR